MLPFPGNVDRSRSCQHLATDKRAADRITQQQSAVVPLAQGATHQQVQLRRVALMSFDKG